MKKELQNRLLEYTVSPPPTVWSEIEAALDDQGSSHAALLYKFEQAPPAGAWDKIENSLAEQSSKVLPINRTNWRVGKFASAAAALLLLASAITFMIVRKEPNDKDMAASVPQEVRTDVQDSPATQYGSNDDEIKNKSGATTNSSLSKSKTAQVTKTNQAATGRYLTIADEAGKRIRLSKKVASVFNCADNIASIKSIRCKENIELLQQKMSASLVSPSGDFSGLMDAIKSLEENN